MVIHTGEETVSKSGFGVLAGLHMGWELAREVQLRS